VLPIQLFVTVPVHLPSTSVGASQSYSIRQGTTSDWRPVGSAVVVLQSVSVDRGPVGSAVVVLQSVSVDRGPVGSAVVVLQSVLQSQSQGGSEGALWKKQVRRWRVQLPAQDEC
jgi:hypothetical protein